MDWKKFYERQIEWYKGEVEWQTKQIEWMTRDLERSRKDDKELLEFVWNKGVLQSWEMRTYGDPKKYESARTHKLKLQRRRAYLKRKKDEQEVKHYMAKLAGLEA